jgi:hypothetical protein
VASKPAVGDVYTYWPYNDGSNSHRNSKDALNFQTNQDHNVDLFTSTVSGCTMTGFELYDDPIP